ncbi:TolC family outer membrane protein [Celeribacter halophilus]|jgi:outer membrane protein|uniref:TolC family outer membrane protein n=1 Tax=Celeribacter halophilus TaxID=576117 RepID=UPI001C09CD16|nr:TolC family outer membrane protein [Celeribacter halophilus]MBU2889113.1 TolC family outer membrane protein [Celeribacter halophilus]MDO6510360.1 TolC family outer membrane protein [Celeribacter halophilus]
MSKSISIRKTLFAGVAALGIGAVPMASWAETLGDALASAYKNSGLLEQNRATLRATDEGVSQAMAALRPSLSYSYSGTKTFRDGDTYLDWYNALSLVASVDLYTFGRNKLAVDVQKEFVLATRAALVNIEQTVLADAVDAYMGVREAQAVLNLRQSAVRLNQQNLRAAQDRFEVGEITRTEVSQYEAQLASTRAELAAAQGELAAARETYKVAIGQYPEKLSSPPNIKLPVSDVEAAVTLAKQKHPGIVALQHEVRAHDITVEVAERSVLPTVDASITHTLNDSDALSYDNNTSLSVGVSGTIYGGGSIASQVREAIADRDASRAELLQTTREVEQSVRTNWSLLSVYAASEEASNAYVKAQRVAYDGVKEEADLGAATTLDVLDAEQDLLDAQVSAIQARIARETQAFSVLQSMGLLTVDQLKLDVPVYDPSAYYNAVKNAPTTYVSPQGEKLDRVLKGLMKD